MWSALRHRALVPQIEKWKLAIPTLTRTLCSSTAAADSGGASHAGSNQRGGLLSLKEVETILGDVKADNVQVIPAREHSEFADFIVIATGRSAWHVRNIAQALIYKVKQKQKGAKRMLLPSVEGVEGGKWIVIDSGPLIIHALDEEVRAYYNLEELWASETSIMQQNQDLDKAFVKVRPKNNSKKRSVTSH